MKNGGQDTKIQKKTKRGAGVLIWGTGILAALPIVLILFTGLFYAATDPAASAPLFEGVILEDPNQRPLHSGYGHFTKAAEITEGMDLTGINVVITGGHSGTGRETARAPANSGAQIIALARDVERTRENMKDIPNVEVDYLDLLKPESVDAFAERFISSGRPVHILINSAGIIDTPLQRDSRGYERQFATNVLGHFQLILRLIPALEQAQGARIVNIASRGHRVGPVHFEDINFEKTEYTGMGAYAQSKTALILLSVKLDALLQDKGIRAFAVHPGPVPETDLWAAGLVGQAPRWQVELRRFSARIRRTFNLTEILNWFRSPANVGDVFKNVEQGGATGAWAAVSEDLNGRGGLYLEDCDIAVLVPDDSEAPFGVRKRALDREAAERIWEICEEMTGVTLAEILGES